MTDRQKAVLLVLADRTGVLTTNELREYVNSSARDDSIELTSALTNAQVLAAGRQLSNKGLVTEDSYLSTMKRWSITNLGRQRAALIEKGV